MWLTELLVSLGVAAGGNIGSLPDIRLETGSSVLITFTVDGEVEALREAAAPPTAGELDMLAQTLKRPEEAMGEKSVQVSTTLLVRPVASEQVRFSFVQVDGLDDTLLIIRNGFNQSFSYKARIGVGGSVRPTDVCQILPGLGGIEHWPYKIDWIEITSIRAAAWKEGDPPRCE